MTKVWNMIYKSGVDGPACTNGLATGPVDTSCKQDTKARDMTAVPLATNRLPQQAGIKLSFKGSLGSNSYFSLVDATLNSGNPCASGAVAGRTADTQHSGPIRAITDEITIPQQTLLDASKTFAVCYDEVTKLPPDNMATVLYPYDATGGSYTATQVMHGAYSTDGGAITVAYGPNVGKTTSATWRDTFIRLQMSLVSKLDIRMADFPNANPRTTTILTHGQIPNMLKDKQVMYTYGGSLPAGNKLQLVDASTGSAADATTQITRPVPCTGTPTNPGTASGSSLTSLTSAATGSSNLDAAKIYALCYAIGAGNLIDSGIRITVPRVTTIRYIDGTFRASPASITTPTTRAEYTRVMTSELTATNFLPQMTQEVTTAAHQEIIYDGVGASALGDGKFLAFVRQDSNSNMPCGNPTLITTSTTTAQQEVSTGATVTSGSYPTKTVGIPNAKLANLGGATSTAAQLNGRYFAVCYSDGAGNAADVKWRDSYIRVGVSKIGDIDAYGVNHNIAGQIPNHAKVKLQYHGSLANNMMVRLVQVQSGALAAGVITAQFGHAGGAKNFPCQKDNTNAVMLTTAKVAPNVAHGATAHGTGFGTTGTGKVITIDTTLLDVDDTYALCYSDSTSVVSTTAHNNFHDSGIRLTVPKIMALSADSGFYQNGVPLRRMASSDSTGGLHGQIIGRPTNTHPQINNVKVWYNAAPTLSASPNGWYISLVATSKNSRDPCAHNLYAKATGGVDNKMTGSARGADIGGTAGAGTVVQIPQATLLDLAEEFAVCYSADNTAAAFYDTYVRVTLTQVHKVTAAAVAISTFGQVPNVPTSDGLKYTLTKSTSMTAGSISLVDASLNPTANGVGSPCANSFAKVAFVAGSKSNSGPTTFASGSDVASPDTQSLDTTKIFAICYTVVAGFQTGWTDSGIRVTVPRVWNLRRPNGNLAGTGAGSNPMYGDSQFTGPACPMVTSANTCHGKACVDYANSQTTNSMLNNACKLDTKQRDMTSRRLSTNVFPIGPDAGTVALNYVGQMSSSMYISIVAADLNSGNPCVKGAIAAQAAGAGGTTGARTSSGPQQASTHTVSFSQTTATTLDATKTYAVCYDEGKDMASTSYAGFGVTPNAYSAVTANQQSYTYVEANIGTSNSLTWRDSYIRLKPSKVAHLTLNLPRLAWHATLFDTISFMTTGQIPKQGASEQVFYNYIGSLPANAKISLVDASLGTEEDAATKITSAYPCDGTNSHSIAGASVDTTHSGVIGTDGASKNVKALATSGLDATKTFALCYSVDGAVSAGNWGDSGLRLTVPKLVQLQFNYQSNGMADAGAFMQTWTAYQTARNKLSVSADMQWQAAASTGNTLGTNAQGIVAFVEASLSSHNPCVNPAQAAHLADNMHSGAIGGTTSITQGATTASKINYAQNVNLQAGSANAASPGADNGAFADANGAACSVWTGKDCDAAIWKYGFTSSQMAALKAGCPTSCGKFASQRSYAVCYTDAGSASVQELGWRDSYIRLTVNKIKNIVASQGTESASPSISSGGQLADHPSLPITNLNSVVSATAFMSLVQFDLEPSALTGGGGPFGFPCTEANAEVASATNQKTGASQAAASIWNVNTQGLQRENGGAIQSYAVCYSEDTSLGAANSGTYWVDSGIRVTVSDVYEIKLASGLTGSAVTPTKEDTRPRHMSSYYLGTNVIPASATAEVTYSTHSTSALMTTGKYFSLVSSLEGSTNPCTFKAVAGTQTAAARYSGVKTATGSTIAVDTTGLSATKMVFRLCYAHVSGSAADTTWRDSFIRIQISKISHLTVLGQTIKTVGQLPNTLAQVGKLNQPANVAAAGFKFEYAGTLANNKWVSLVDAGSHAFPCDQTRATAVATATNSAPKQAGGSDKVVTDLDTNTLTGTLSARTTANDARSHSTPGAALAWGDTTLGALAVCYHDGASVISAFTGTTQGWADSGLRVTVTKLSTLTMTSGYTDPYETYTRYMTATPAATNRIPRIANVAMSYQGTLAASMKIALVKQSSNSNQPCVNPSITAAIPNGAPTNGAVTSGAMIASAAKLFTVPQGANNLLETAGMGYAVCYAEGDGSATDLTWRDSFIVLKTSDVSTFSALGVVHKTYGQVPHHVAGVVFAYGGALGVNKFISMVDETKGSYHPTTSFVNSIPNPCECSGAGCNDKAKTAAGTTATGVATAVTKNIATMATTALDTSKTFAVCYSTDNALFKDSGIRVTIPKAFGVKYSGWKVKAAGTQGKTARLMQSVVASKQPLAEIVANVIPKDIAGLSLQYEGSLPASMWISIVELSQNTNNPCVDPTNAAAAHDTTHSGVARACKSMENLCLDGTANGDKEVTFTGGSSLANQEFAVCYASTDGTGTDQSWTDTYIRLRTSDLTSITTHGVPIKDHGTVAFHSGTYKLPVTYTGSLIVNKHLVFVDETLGSNNPCGTPAIAGAAQVATESTGPGQAGAATKVVGLTTSNLVVTKQYAVCYASGLGNPADATWADSGIRVRLSQVSTVRSPYDHV